MKALLIVLVTLKSNFLVIALPEDTVCPRCNDWVGIANGCHKHSQVSSGTTVKATFPQT